MLLVIIFKIEVFNVIGIENKQVEMHKNFFDKCTVAIENGFFLEAIFIEYAAIEGRLEIILGVLGLPCNKDLPNDLRRKVLISHRIECLNRIFKMNKELFKKTKLEKTFFDKLKKWTEKRNTYVHGLYKNANDYREKKGNSKQLAVSGELLARKLYNEAKRLRRLKQRNSELFHNSNLSCIKINCKI